MASILWVPLIFALSAGGLWMLSANLPSLDTIPDTHSVNSSAVKFPSNLEELRALAQFLSFYRSNHMGYVVALFSSAYIFKQTFAIPGSVFLNLLAGALFHQWMGFFLTCALSASGATCCFYLSNFFGRDYIVRHFSAKLAAVQSKVQENHDSLLFFLLFLRLFPITPNWFLNLAAPIVNIPPHLFFLSVFIGLMPYNFITVQTGCILSQLTSVDDILNFWTMLKLFAIANAALVPGLVIKHLHEERLKKKQKQS